MNKLFMKSLDEIISNPKGALDKEGSYRKPGEVHASDLVLVTSDAKALLIQRLFYPFGWAIPGGKVDKADFDSPKIKLIPDYAFINAALREASEEVSFNSSKLSNDFKLYRIGVYSGNERDIRGNFISHAYLGVVNIPFSELNVKAGDDAGALKWMSIDEVQNLIYLSQGLNQYVKDAKLAAYELINFDNDLKKKVVNVLCFDHDKILTDGLGLYNKIKNNPGDYESIDFQ